MSNGRLSGAITDPEESARIHMPHKRKSWFRRNWKKLKKIFGIPGLCIYAIPAIILYFLRFRFARISNPKRIGHIATDPDWYLKEVIIRKHPLIKPILLISKKECPNLCLLQYWERYYSIVWNDILISALKPFFSFPFLKINLYRSAIEWFVSGTYPDFLTQWGSRPPLLALSEDHRKQGEEALAELGVPPDAWFVCVHAREGGYSPGDEHVHEFRSCSIESYGLAMEAIVERGGWCIRVGDSSMRPLPPTSGVIDYVHLPQKSDWMDVYLLASCRFMLGNTSGPYNVSSVFGVPVVLANLAPMAMAYPSSPRDIGIPKLLKWKNSGDFVKFSEVLDSPAASFFTAEQFENCGVVHIDNSPDEIRDLTVEMMDRLDGIVTYTDEDERFQARFRELFSPGRSESGPESHIGRDFLRKYASLM